MNLGDVQGAVSQEATQCGADSQPPPGGYGAASTAAPQIEPIPQQEAKEVKTDSTAEAHEDNTVDHSGGLEIPKLEVEEVEMQDAEGAQPTGTGGGREDDENYHCKEENEEGAAGGASKRPSTNLTGEAEQSERRRLRRRLAQAVAAVDHMAYLVAQLQHSQAFQATRRVSGQEEKLGPSERRALAEAHAKRVSDIISKQCMSVLKNLQGHKWGWPFNQPVDTNQFTDYLKTVSHPMDLGTIKQRIEAGRYKDPEQFAADMRLVFANAKVYNPPGTDVHVMASTLKVTKALQGVRNSEHPQGKFEERWQSVVVPKIADEMNTCKTEEVAAERRLQETRRARELELYDRRSAQLLAEIDALEIRLADDKASAARLCRPLSRSAREELRMDLPELDDKALAEVVRTVTGRYPGTLSAASGIVEIDVDALDALTLRQLRAIVRRSKPEDSAASPPNAPSKRISPSSGIPKFLPPRSIRLARQVKKSRVDDPAGGDSAAPGQQQAAVLLAHGKLAEQSSNSLPSLEGKNVEQDPQSAAEEGRTGGGGLHFSGSSPALLNAASDPPKPAANEGGGVEARAKDAMERRKAGVTLS